MQAMRNLLDMWYCSEFETIFKHLLLLQGTLQTFRRQQNEPSNPSIFCQILSFEFFTQSESMGSVT